MIVKDLFCNNEAYTHEGWEYSDVYSRFSRLYYVIDGEAYYREGDKTERLKKGCLYLTPVKTPFSLFENPKDKLLHTYVHIYTVPEVSSFTEIEVKENTPLFDAVSLWRKYSSSTDKELLISIIELLLSLVDRELGKEQRAATLAKRYIDAKEGENIDMEELSHAVGYTREHITRTFKAVFRLTPTEYVTSRRMEEARRSLEGGKSVTRTSEELGYSSPYAMSRAFKRHFGLSPENYLKTLG